ncbi:hypothetical protein [Streptomyces sp. NPDC101237]|uniref:hypothetical protein n=1 Tax=Streptomyces sp. NPDC101237 TaxID=3366139 RepID=UPI00382E722D
MADPGSGRTLYVDHDVKCGDSGTGTQGLPFRTVRAAADVTRPLSFTKGHTAAGRALVKVGADGAIDLHHAGTVAIDVSADLVGDDLVLATG